MKGGKEEKGTNHPIPSQRASTEVGSGLVKSQAVPPPRARSSLKARPPDDDFAGSAGWLADYPLSPPLFLAVRFPPHLLIRQPRSDRALAPPPCTRGTTAPWPLEKEEREEEESRAVGGPVNQSLDQPSVLHFWGRPQTPAQPTTHDTTSSFAVAAHRRRLRYHHLVVASFRVQWTDKTGSPRPRGPALNPDGTQQFGQVPEPVLCLCARPLPLQHAFHQWVPFPLLRA